MKCDLCHTHQASKSGIVQSVFYKHICEVCLAGAAQVSSGHARWQRGMDVEDHAFDLAQPWNADGTPNADFIKAYPKQSLSVFTKDELAAAVRK